jgi:hypothetical protein
MRNVRRGERKTKKLSLVSNLMLVKGTHRPIPVFGGQDLSKFALEKDV